MRVNFGKTNVMVSGCIMKDGLAENKLCLYGICSSLIDVISLFYLRCGKCIYCRFACLKWVTAKCLQYV